MLTSTYVKPSSINHKSLTRIIVETRSRKTTGHDTLPALQYFFEGDNLMNALFTVQMIYYRNDPTLWHWAILIKDGEITTHMFDDTLKIVEYSPLENLTREIDRQVRYVQDSLILDWSNAFIWRV